MPAEIFRRDLTVYVDADGYPAVLFHLSRASSDLQLAHVDKLIELAIISTDQARPARRFFDSVEKKGG